MKIFKKGDIENNSIKSALKKLKSKLKIFNCEVKKPAIFFIAFLKTFLVYLRSLSYGALFLYYN